MGPVLYAWAGLADKKAGMAAWTHRCPWCGWSRDAASATMLEPRCGECGGLLESLQSVAAPAVASPFRVPQRGLSPAFGRLLRVVLVGLLMFAAARVGWDAGGIGLAVAGLGLVGLFTVPLIVGE